jgi:hypothetical protein
MVKRDRRVEIRLTGEELTKAEALAAEYGLTISDLFRDSALKRNLPRRVTQVTGQSYWELVKIEVSLSQLLKAIITAQLKGEPIADYLHSIQEIKELATQLRHKLLNSSEAPRQ